MTYFISDLHFGHKNCLAYDNRNFKSIEEHDEYLIKQWNDKVGMDDEVWILGDVSWHNVTKTIEIFKRLNGIKKLCIGNHDKQYLKNKDFRDLFAEICHYKELEIGKDFIVLSHYPILFWNGQHKDWIHLYGHVHMTDEWKLYTQSLDSVNDYFKDKEKKGYTDCPPALAFNVGCMLPYMNYCPRTLKEILENN